MNEHDTHSHIIFRMALSPVSKAVENKDVKGYWQSSAESASLPLNPEDPIVQLKEAIVDVARSCSALKIDDTSASTKTQPQKILLNRF